MIPLNNLKKTISKYSKNTGRVFLLILHEVSGNEMARFKELIMRLKNKYNFLDPMDFITFINGDLKLTKDHLLLSFDDGFFSNYQVAKKILKPLEIKAVFFIPSGFIDSSISNENERYIQENIYDGELSSDIQQVTMKAMSWKNLSELVDMGHIIGSHSKNHLRLSDINDIDLLEEEIISSGDRIEQILGIKVEHFAFPFGDINSVNKKVLELARTRYKYIYSGVRGPNSNDTNPFAIRREALNISDEFTYNTFVAGGGLSFYYWRARQRLDAMVK